jgi:UDP-GlcNAc:undecaprenyl-phosphate GlcNAc-1-phosphate transferase
LPLTIGWIVLATNAVNLIDGLDGLASGLALVATLGVLAVVGPGAGSGVIAAVLAGALVGFLWFNVPPALIFMGDAGSLFVGFAVATLTLRGSMRAGPETFPVLPLLLLAVPLTDATSAIVRRIGAAARAAGSPRELVREARARVMAPDRGHLHHRLLDAGLPSRVAALALQLSALPFAIAAALIVHVPVAGWVLAVLATSAWVALWRIVGTRLASGEPDVGALAVAAVRDDAWEREAA